MTNSKTTILVVDDDEIIRDMICLMLSKLGYETTPACDAVEAIKSIKHIDTFNMVLTDINMPIIDGWELALCINTLKPYLPIIAVTGEPPINVIPKLKGSGICHALFKPIKFDDLKDSVSFILESEEPKQKPFGNWFSCSTPVS